MALTFQGGAQQALIPTRAGVILTLYPAFNVTTGLSSIDEVEVRRAPDNGGVPGTPVTIDRLPPLPARGYVFVDDRPLTPDVWWYSHRHIKADGAIVGAWSGWEAATAHIIFPNDQRLLVPPAADAGAVNTSSRYLCEVYTNSYSLATGSPPSPVPMDAEFSDVGNLHSLVTNTARITIPSVNNLGVWLFTLAVIFPANGTGVRSLQLWKNGSAFAEGPGGAMGASAVVMAFSEFDINPAPADYFELRALQTSGGNLTVSARLSVVHLW